MRIHRTIFLFVWLFLTGYGIFSQDMEKNILYIRECYYQINQNQADFDKIVYGDIGLYKDISPDRYSMEGAEIYNLAIINSCQYSENGSVKKIVMTFNGPDENLVSEYYIRDDQLVFVFKTRTCYLKPKWSDDFSENDKVVFENRFYIKNNSLIKWINEKKQVVLDQAVRDMAEKTLIHDYKVYLTISDDDIGIIYTIQ